MDKGLLIILVAAAVIASAIFSTFRYKVGIYEGTWIERCKHVQCLDNSKARWLTVDDKDACVCLNSSVR